MPVKILYDTDIGSDIDDAVCLAYLLAQPDCDLLGVTTVTGDVELRARMVSALCKVAGRSVPIFPGAAQPLLVPQRQPDVPQAAALARWPHDQGFPRDVALDFLRQTIHAHPGEVVLLGTGPLTNIALLFAVDPQIPALLQGLVLMCGVFAPPEAGQADQREWNAQLDPHATAMVYRAPVRRHRSIGLDVTTQVTMDAQTVREHFQHPLLRPVLDFAQVWFQERDILTFHDPLAATTIFDEGICVFKQGRVEVEVANPDAAGRTYWHPGAPDGPHEVALAVDRDRFFAHYFSVFQ